MEDYQKRMIEECKSLIERTAKLEFFLDSDKKDSIDPKMLELMRRQLTGMIVYRDALVGRLELLGLADEVYEYPELEDGEEFETENGTFRCVGHDENGCPICERID